VFEIIREVIVLFLGRVFMAEVVCQLVDYFASDVPRGFVERGLFERYAW
jgi:hypothetical protein